jgi:hypothetical protein
MRGRGWEGKSHAPEVVRLYPVVTGANWRGGSAADERKHAAVGPEGVDAGGELARALSARHLVDPPLGEGEEGGDCLMAAEGRGLILDTRVGLVVPAGGV